MLIRQVALVSETNQITPSDLSRVCAALQKQVTRDFSPIWEMSATVDAFVKLEDVPVGYWPIIVMDDINVSGAAGVHEDKNAQPFALVTYGEDWALTASHECLEMLADPSGNRLSASSSIKPGQNKVNYLVEVCDPSEDVANAYTVNGLSVSDFYTPHYFDPTTAGGVRYSYTGSITEPRQVLPGGYLSWTDPATDEWWQCRYFTSKQEIVSLGSPKRDGRSLRSMIDELTGIHIHDSVKPGRGAKESAILASVSTKGAPGGYVSSVAQLSDSYANLPTALLRAEIATLKKRAPR